MTDHSNLGKSKWCLIELIRNSEKESRNGKDLLWDIKLPLGLKIREIIIDYIGMLMDI